MIPSDSQISFVSSATCTSDLSIFEQHLPQEPQRFRVALHEKAGPRRKVAFRSRGSYDFTVLPLAKSPHSRGGSPDRVNSALQPCPEHDELQDEHFALYTKRAFFRHQRLDHFNAGRQFPVLVSPRFLPSFKHVTDDLKRNQDSEEAFPPLPKLTPESKDKEPVKMTVSVLRQRQANERRPKPSKSKHNILPFIPGGNRQKSIPHGRWPAPMNDSYDEPKEALKMEMRVSKSKQLCGAFKPSSAKPYRKPLGPLSFCRSQMAATTPVNWCFRRGTSLQECIPVVDTEKAGQEVPDGEPSEPRSRSNSEIPDPKSRCNSELLEQPDGKNSARGSVARTSCLLVQFVEEGPRETSSMGAIPIFPLKKKEDEASSSGSLFAQAKKHDVEKERAKEKEGAATAQFWKIADEGKVHHDDVPKALTSLGFVNPKPEWIDEAFKKVTKYVSICLDDFLYFLTCYESLQLAYYKQEFEQCDEDGSGQVECDELIGLMKKLGILPMKHVLDQVVAEVDENGNGELDFGEFEAVMDILRRREGFAKEEFDEISSLFKRFDRDGSGSMDTKEVHMALKWLGFSFKDDQADKIIREVDQDGSGQIDEIEWFVCMRKVREVKIDKLRQVMRGCDENNDGSIQYSELQSLLQALGYVPEYEAVYEAAAAACIQEDDEDLDLGELWRLLAVFREREGLSQQDLDMVETVFNKNAKAIEEGDEPEADTLDIGKMCRYMGYVVDFELQQSLTAKVDIDGTGKLDRREFRKMVRMIHDKDIELFRSAFHDCALAEVLSKLKGTSVKSKFMKGSKLWTQKQGTATSGNTLTTRQALQALRRVGCTDSHAVLESFLGKDAGAGGRVDFYKFCQAAIHSRRTARGVFRKNGGFTEEEIVDLRELFNRYDSDSSGNISGLESLKLFETEFPAISNDPSKRVELVEQMKLADQDGNNALEFGDFLRIMRHLRDVEDQLRVGKEREAFNATKFTPQEVEEFRELFLSAGQGLKELGFSEVKELLKCIVPMGTKNVEDLKRKFDEQSAGKQCGDLQGDDEGLDFPEFLLFMRSLLDMNFANMSEKAEKIVEKDGTTSSS